MNAADVNSLSLAAAAAWYAAQGCRVFPLPPRAKAAKLAGWQDKATTDLEQVRRWWADQPGANIAVLCGDPFDVVDLDGPDALAAVRERFGENLPPVLGWVKTPNGWHGWIPSTGKPRRIGVLDHVDYLGAGGYVVAPPSVVDGVDKATGEFVTGRRYEWTAPPVLDPDPAPDCSGWLALFDTPTPTASAAERPSVAAGGPNAAWVAAMLTGAAENVRTALEGQRNHTLNERAYRVGRYVAGGHLARAEAESVLLDAARGCGLGDAEARATIRSGLDAGAKEPADPPEPRTADHKPPAAATTPRTPEADRTHPVSVEDVYGPPTDPPDAEGSGADGGRQGRVTWACTIDPEPVVWVWGDGAEGRIPSGSLSLAAGREGTGKSSFGLWLAAQVTGGTLPGHWYGRPRSVLYVAVEDSWKYTLVPRLIAAGADRSLVGRFDVVTEHGDEVTLSLPGDNRLLEAEIRRHRVALVVIDPLMSVIGEKLDTHRTREVRVALDPLAKLADRTGAVVLGIAHFNKASGTDAAALLSGSHAFRDVPRTIFGFARDDQDDTGGRIMSQVKNSLGRDDLPSLSYRIESADIDTPNGTANTGRFVFLGESERSVADVLRDSRTNSAGDPDERRDAAGWIDDYLSEAGGSAPAREVLAAGRAAGFTDQTMKNARSKVADSERRGFGKGSAMQWVLRIGTDHRSLGTTPTSPSTYVPMGVPMEPERATPTSPDPTREHAHQAAGDEIRDRLDPPTCPECQAADRHAHQRWCSGQFAPPELRPEHATDHRQDDDQGPDLFDAEAAS